MDKHTLEADAAVVVTLNDAAGMNLKSLVRTKAIQRIWAYMLCINIVPHIKRVQPSLWDYSF